MCARSEKSDSDFAEIDIVELWGRIKLLFLKYKYWMIFAPGAFGLMGYALSRIPSPQWEGSVVLQVGRVSSSELIEPMENINLRLGMTSFKRAVLDKCGIPLNSAEAALYNKSLISRPLKPFGVMEIRVRGLSKESVSRLSSCTVAAVREAHSSMALQTLEGPKRRLFQIDKWSNAMASAIKKDDKLSSENKALADIFFAYLGAETMQRKLDLTGQIDFTEQHPTIVVDEVANDAPVYPRTSLWILLSGLLGVFGGILGLLSLACCEK